MLSIRPIALLISLLMATPAYATIDLAACVRNLRLSDEQRHFLTDLLLPLTGQRALVGRDAPRDCHIEGACLVFPAAGFGAQKDLRVEWAWETAAPGLE